MANATAASALDIDDGNRSAGGHPGAAVIPAVLAAVEGCEVSGRELLSAIAIGYEVAVRISASRDLASLYALSTGRWGGYGALAAAAWIRRTPQMQLAQALAISGELSPWLIGSGFSRQMGNQIKEGIPWSVHAGLLSLEMASNGMTGPLDLFDNADHFNGDAIVENFADPFQIEKTYFKPYACCRWIHSALDALSELMNENALRADDIVSIRVATVARGLTLNNEPDPKSIESAQYSFPFCLAALAVNGSAALLPMSTDLLGQTETVRLAECIEVECDFALDRLFPGKCPAEIYLKTRKGEWTRRVDDALGDPDHPLSMDQLVEKFLILSTPTLGADWAGKLSRIILNLEDFVDTTELRENLTAAVSV